MQQPQTRTLVKPEQTGVALSTVATSNSIAVAGINTGAVISVTGGTYSINGGTYTDVTGAVNAGDTVTVRQTSSTSFSTMSTTTLTIGSVSAAFKVTTQAPVTSYTAPSSTGTGNITASFTGGGANCSFVTAAYTTATPPSGITLPHGVFSFTTTDCGAGATLNFTITYPQDLPAGAKYYKFGPEFHGDSNPHWYVLPGAVVSGKQITFSITDNGQGDSNPAAGFITDPGGVGVPAGSASGVTGVPTLSEWGMIMLTLLIGLMALPALRQRRC